MAENTPPTVGYVMIMFNSSTADSHERCYYYDYVPLYTTQHITSNEDGFTKYKTICNAEPMKTKNEYFLLNIIFPFFVYYTI